MKIGVCAKPSQAKLAAEAGFEYIEPSCNWLRELDEKELSEARSQLEEAGIAAESFNCFFHGDFDLYGDDRAGLMDSVRMTLERAAYLGCRTAVIGSGKARALRDGVDRDRAFSIFCGIISESAEIAGKYGINIAVEPLRRAETNFINTVSDGVEIARAVNKPNVGTMVDFYHFYCNGEDLSELDKAGPWLVHAHTARPHEDRRWPQEEDLDTVELWADKLRDIGYDGRLTLECSWKGMFDEKVKEGRVNLSAFK